MNYEQLKRASVQTGFIVRINQLRMKQAAIVAEQQAEQEALQKEAFARMLQRFTPRLGQAAAETVPFTSRAAGGVGSGIGKMVGAPISAVRSLLTPSNQAGALSHLVGGLGEGFMGAFGAKGKAMGQSFRRTMTRPVQFGAAPKPAPVSGLSDAAMPRGAAPKAAPAGAPGARSKPTTAAPGTITPEAMRSEGMLAPTNRNWTGGPQGELFPGMTGDPTKGLLGRMKGMLPQGAQDWVGNNPNLASAAAGAVGGGALVQGGNAYGDHKRRQALANASIMQRLGLAFQLATNPEGFANTIRL